MENKEAAKYIERIKIKGLWGRYDVDWELKSDVNILVGENGTGKSTILEIVKLLIMEHCADIRKKCESMYLVLNNNESVGPNDHGIASLKSPFLTLNTFFIKTFDAPFFIKTEKESSRKPYIKSPLDDDLDAVMDVYVDYQLNQNKKLRANGKTYETVFAKQKYLIETLNRLFLPSEKRVDEDENRLSFLIMDNQKITSFELSSGEKQLLIILLTVLCQDEKPSVLLMDEPELSLHITWQYELIKIIRQLNPNCQVIIATHSTSIFTKGWMDKLFFMDGVEGIRHKIAQLVKKNNQLAF